MIASAGKDETALRRLAHRITDRLARATFRPITTANDGGIAIAYRPTLLIDAIWQQFAREAGTRDGRQCPAPTATTSQNRESGRG